MAVTPVVQDKLGPFSFDVCVHAIPKNETIQTTVVHVSGVATGNYEAIPSSVDFGATAAHANVTSELIVRHLDGADFTIAHCGEMEGVSISFDSIHRAAQKITLFMTSDSPGQIRETLNMRLIDSTGSAEMLPVPVVGYRMIGTQ